MNFSTLTMMSMLMADGTEKHLVVRSTDAAGVQRMVLGDAVQLDGCWGLMPPLGKVPNDVQDVEDNVRLDDSLLEVVGS